MVNSVYEVFLPTPNSGAMAPRSYSSSLNSLVTAPSQGVTLKASRDSPLVRKRLRNRAVRALDDSAGRGQSGETIGAGASGSEGLRWIFGAVSDGWSAAFRSTPTAETTKARGAHPTRRSGRRSAPWLWDGMCEEPPWVITERLVVRSSRSTPQLFTITPRRQRQPIRSFRQEHRRYWLLGIGNDGSARKVTPAIREIERRKESPEITPSGCVAPPGEHRTATGDRSGVPPGQPPR
ncbi:hypothetical protein SAMN04489716_6699 [Actinoplanes derwentensis]|uniref:Uncharacterized protein n=1 Tax=Actinoplanes derwentensis TaxID=113562 RepID=A0A1H2CT49_9ACTN|nr:hypothetical protein SAMN04489716_6699 [Actinoplanes derwentensis]